MAAAVAAVQAIVPANFDGSVTGSIEVGVDRHRAGGTEVDFTDNSQTKSDTWALNIAPDVDDPTIASNLTGDYLLIKEDNSGSVTFTATRAAGTDDVLTQLDVSGQDPSATYAYTLSVNGGAFAPVVRRRQAA